MEDFSLTLSYVPNLYYTQKPWIHLLTTNQHIRTILHFVSWREFNIILCNTPSWIFQPTNRFSIVVFYLSTMASNNPTEADLDTLLTLLGFIDINKVEFVKDDLNLRYFEDYLSINLAFIKTLPGMTASLPIFIPRGAPHRTTCLCFNPKMSIGLNSFCLWIQGEVWCNVDIASIDIEHFNQKRQDEYARIIKELGSKVTSEKFR